MTCPTDKALEIPPGDYRRNGDKKVISPRTYTACVDGLLLLTNGGGDFGKVLAELNVLEKKNARGETEFPALRTGYDDDTPPDDRGWSQVLPVRKGQRFNIAVERQHNTKLWFMPNPSPGIRDEAAAAEMFKEITGDSDD